MTMSKFFENLYLNRGCDYAEDVLEEVLEMYENDENNELKEWMDKNKVTKIDLEWIWDYTD